MHPVDPSQLIGEGQQFTQLFDAKAKVAARRTKRRRC